MLFVTVHCGDEIDRELLIPLHEAKEVHTNADGGDWIAVGEEIYQPRIQDNFYMSVVDIGAWKE